MMPENTPDGMEWPDDDTEVLDVTEFFDDLGDGPAPKGRPDDYPGVEVQTILHTLPGSVAGKQYRPDPSGDRRAVTASEYRLGTNFFATQVDIQRLEDVLDLLQALSTDKTAFLVRGAVAEKTPRRRRRDTGEAGFLIKRRMAERHEDGALMDIPRRLQMADLDGIPLADGM